MATIGGKIKELRKSKGMSQTQVAQALGVTSQAVSKWETDSTLPEMTLLPDIAALFGIQIDDLFEYSKEKQYEKIGEMIGSARSMTNEEFIRAESFLLRELQADPDSYQANSMLGDLYLFEAECLNKKALRYSKAALELKPNSKADMSTISHAGAGKMYDWNIANHHELIDYWYKLLRDEPENVRAYFYLLDNLVDDGRIAEARKVLDESRKNNPDTLNDAYEVWIEENVRGFAAVKADYEALAERYPNDWRVLFNIANSFSHNEYYSEAVTYWQRAFDAMEPPRYTDFFDAMAQCYVRMGDKQKAAQTLRRELELLKSDWGIKFGRSVDEINERIEKLK